MIHKVLYIRNYAQFLNFVPVKGDWNGIFGRCNVICAPNGSGKTSISILFRSINNQSSLLGKKKSFRSTGPVEAKFILGDKTELAYSLKWNRHLDEIEVFDSFYAEKNIYSIAVDSAPGGFNQFELGVKGIVAPIRQDLADIGKRRHRLNDRRKALKSEIKITGGTERKRARYEDILTEIQSLNTRITDLERQLVQKTESQRDLFLAKANSYLAQLSDDIKLTAFSRRNPSILLYVIKIHSMEIKLNERNKYSLKYALSEGDKNALALSFFLAKLDLIPNLMDYVVVVDDPFSSFDQHRKLSTVKNLLRLSERVGQLILLTHDLLFANEFSAACNYGCVNLTIRRCGDTNVIAAHDIRGEANVGIAKDIRGLHEFLNHGGTSEVHLRDVVRCIRPSVEGMFRLKFMDQIGEKEWLGDIISRIRAAEEGSDFHRLQDRLVELEDINDYCKRYHHSSPTLMEEPISEGELRSFVRRTIEVIAII